MEHRMNVPLNQADLSELRAGDVVYLSGTIYTARDAAHARFDKMLIAGETLPVPKGACIYYCGPCPAAPGEIIGPCGPTTSKRMDAYTPALIEYGIAQFIGKGARNSTVNAAMKGRAVHFAATGGAGMLYASRITACELVAFADLGAEAVYRLEVRDFPVVVTFDLLGNDVYARTTQN
ncbi:MAG TPA: FumA C-terminus/TtdB family hydratase beta subunit [Clostridia bacterium]|nr:FumA C-terminus/TtdB family hydratase beta subunit [Clostridia bacterium]